MWFQRAAVCVSEGGREFFGGAGDVLRECYGSEVESAVENMVSALKDTVERKSGGSTGQAILGPPLRYASCSSARL